MKQRFLRARLTLLIVVLDTYIGLMCGIKHDWYHARLTKRCRRCGTVEAL